MTTAATTTTIRKVEIFCRGCNAEIRFDKNHRTTTGKWIPLNMDLSHHDCPAKQKRHQYQPQQPVTIKTAAGLSKEIAAIKAQLLALVGRLDRLEQELQKK
jgi:hypothetical protein